MRRRTLWALAAAALGAALWASTGTAGGKPTLVVYSAQGYDKAMVDAFQKATGIPTKLDDNSTWPLLAWARGVLPLLSRPLLFAWLLTFTGVFLELPISQLLYTPSAPPISVSIENDNTYHFGVGMAQATLACALGAVAIVLGGYRWLAPRGWRRIGEAVHA